MQHMAEDRKPATSKWQLASCQLNDIRFTIEKILDHTFTDEEKESERYHMLVEDLRRQLTYTLTSKLPKDPEEAKNKLITWQNFIVALISAILTGAAAILATILK